MPTKKINIEQEEEIVETVVESMEIDDSLYETSLPAKYKSRKPYIVSNPNDVMAFMPGTVRKIFVQEKDVIKKGTKVMVLDAMKMNNEILSPIDGEVKKIPVKIGESVPKHTVLMEIVPIKKGQKFTNKK